MAEDDARGPGADSARRLNEAACFECEHGAAHDAGEDRRVYDGDRDDHVVRVRAKGGNDAERQQDRRKSEEDVHHATDREIGPASEIPRDEAERSARERCGRNREEAHAHRKPRSEEDPAQEITAQRIGPKEMLSRRSRETLRGDLERIAERQEADGERDERVARDHEQANERSRLTDDRGCEIRETEARPDGGCARRGGFGDPGSHTAGPR